MRRGESQALTRVGNITIPAVCTALNGHCAISDGSGRQQTAARDQHANKPVVRVVPFNGSMFNSHEHYPTMRYECIRRLMLQV